MAHSVAGSLIWHFYYKALGFFDNFAIIELFPNNFANNTFQRKWIVKITYKILLEMLNFASFLSF